MAVKTMNLRRDDRCVSCAIALAAGTMARWDSDAKTVTCLACAGASDSPPQPKPAGALDAGTAGESARLEFERRHAKRETQIEAKWGTGRLGRIAKFLSDDPQSTTAWKTGAAGEERVAAV